MEEASEWRKKVRMKNTVLSGEKRRVEVFNSLVILIQTIICRVVVRVGHKENKPVV